MPCSPVLRFVHILWRSQVLRESSIHAVNNEFVDGFARYYPEGEGHFELATGQVSVFSTQGQLRMNILAMWTDGIPNTMLFDHRTDSPQFVALDDVTEFRLRLFVQENVQIYSDRRGLTSWARKQTMSVLCGEMLSRDLTPNERNANEILAKAAKRILTAVRVESAAKLRLADTQSGLRRAAEILSGEIDSEHVLYESNMRGSFLTWKRTSHLLGSNFFRGRERFWFARKSDVRVCRWLPHVHEQDHRHPHGGRRDDPCPAFGWQSDRNLSCGCQGIARSSLAARWADASLAARYTDSSLAASCADSSLALAPCADSSLALAPGVAAREQPHPLAAGGQQPLEGEASEDVSIRPGSGHLQASIGNGREAGAVSLPFSREAGAPGGARRKAGANLGACRQAGANLGGCRQAGANLGACRQAGAKRRQAGAPGGSCRGASTRGSVSRGAFHPQDAWLAQPAERLSRVLITIRRKAPGEACLALAPRRP